MLYAKVVLWVKQEETTSDSKVILYRGDKNVDIEFTLKSVDYILSESVEAQLVLVRPHAKSVFSQLHKINQNKVRFTITGDMIDELDEMEAYAIQIRLFGPNTTARATLPPCYDVIYVKHPIATEPYEEDEIARANYANANLSRTITDFDNIGEVFTDGLYNKTVWVDGDLITVGRLNKIEDALYVISDDEEEREQLEKNTSDIADLFDRVEEGGMSEEEREQLEKNTSDISTILGIIDAPPTYTQPTLSLSVNPNIIQHDNDTDITINCTFKQNDAGDITNYILSRNGETLHTDTVASQYTDTIKMNHGESVTYSAIVEYSDGVIKETLLGIPYPDTSIKAGSVTSTGSVRAYALSYYGVVDTNVINDVSGLSSRLSTSKSYTYTANLTEQHIVYIYPKSFGTLTSIKDSNNFDYINSYTRSTALFDGVEYYIYILTDPVTINDFKQIFN